MFSVAYLGSILYIKPIDKADKLELAIVVCGKGGKWTGVVQKGVHKIGEIVEVYLPDAIVPSDDERFSFMKSHKYRVSQHRFRGAPSECLIMPNTTNETEPGTDIMGIIGIKKYEKEDKTALGGKVLQPFPRAIIPMTDEPNWQSVNHMVTALIGYQYYITRKMDGSSGTVYKYDGHFGCCSRRLELKEEDGKAAVWKIANKYNLRDRLPEGYAIQFEMCGPKIQGNSAELTFVDGFVFNVWDINNRKYLDFSDARKFLADCCWMEWVPVVSAYGYWTADNCAEIQNYAHGCYPGTDVQQEGIVIRPTNEMQIDGERLSFKVINLNYKER